MTPEGKTPGNGYVPPVMQQVAPYPAELADLVSKLSYREDRGWEVNLAAVQRDKPGRHAGEARGLTLIVTRHGPDTYNPVSVESAARILLGVLAEHKRDSPEAAAAVRDLRWSVKGMITVDHYFPVPAATYNRASWQRWLFDQLGKVDDHERMEDFVIGGRRPYAPVHAPGWDPYMVTELADVAARETDFRGDRHEGSQR